MTSRIRISYFLSILLPFATALLIFGSCVKPSINFGTAFVNDNNTNIVVVDTFSSVMSTVYFDSFPTSGTGSILVGRYKDNGFGIVTSKTYYQLAPPRVLPTISNQAGYDSLVLITRLNNYFYGDTSVSQQYVVSQLKNNIQFPGNQFAFFNNDSVPTESSPLGVAAVTINPRAGYTSQLANDSLKVRLSDAQGFELFRMIQSVSDTVTNTNIFLGYFKGVSMAPGASTMGALYGFKDTVVMRLYYHEPGVVMTPKFTDFIIWNRAFQWNQITYDRTGTPLQLLPSLKSPVPGTPVEISSDSTANAIYVQNGTAVHAKLKFPYLWQLVQRPDFVSVLKAELDLSPLAGSYSPEITLPTQLQIFTTDEKNQVGVPIAAAGTAYGNFKIDYIYNVNTTYKFDITSFIKSQIAAGIGNVDHYGVMISIPAPLDNTTFNRVILPDKNNPNQSTKVVLKIYYASYY